MRSEARSTGAKREGVARRLGPGRGIGGRVRRIDAERSSLTAILNLVRLGAAKTRHEIEVTSGLGRAVVANRLGSLIALGLVDEDEIGQASGGRAPRLVRFRSDTALVLVGALDPTSLSVGISDLSGRLLNEHHEAFELGAGPAATLERLETLFDWLLDQHRHDREVWHVTLAVPGPGRRAEGERFAWPAPHFLPAWNDYPLVEQLMLRRRVPVQISSSVQMKALGELRAGSAVGQRDAIFVDLNREISAAIFSEGRLHRGTDGAAGLIGHTSCDDDGALVCRCGNVGCLELFAGADAIAREGTRAAVDGRSRYLAEALASNGEIVVSDIGIAAQLGDPLSAELLSRAGRLVGTVLAGLVNAFNPSVIVLSGAVAQTGDIFLAAVREAVYRRSHPLVTRDLRIVRSQMASSAGLVGSAIAAIDAIFEPSFLESWINLGSPLRHPTTERLIASAGGAATKTAGRPRPPDKAGNGRS